MNIYTFTASLITEYGYENDFDMIAEYEIDCGSDPDDFAVHNISIVPNAVKPSILHHMFALELDSQDDKSQLTWEIEQNEAANRESDRIQHDMDQAQERIEDKLLLSLVEHNQ